MKVTEKIYTYLVAVRVERSAFYQVRTYIPPVCVGR